MSDRPDCDLVSGRFYADDAHAAFSWMRTHEPIYHDRTNDLHAVTLHEDIMYVSKNTDVFCSGRGFRPDSAPLPMMISMDRPEHMVRRNLVNRGFTPRRVAELEPRVREICRGIVDRIIEKGECDFVRDVAAPLPLVVIADLLGVVEEDHDSLLRWSDDLMTALGSDDPELLAKQARAGAEYAAYNARVVADRRANPGGDDLMALLVDAEIDGERLDDFSIQMESLLILIGGDETTRHVISGGMHQLLLHPDQLAALVRDPERIPCAVEEMLRWVTPIQNMMRTTTCDTELRGVELPEGSRILLMYPSANRDDAVFERPFEFDIARSPNPHVAFGGYGNHFCLGNALARLELRVMFEELLPRLRDVVLTEPEAPKLRPANFVVGIEALPIRFEPGPIGGEGA
jgi:cytochrome P450 family 142 subfamily A polypeptide 1